MGLAHDDADTARGKLEGTNDSPEHLAVALLFPPLKDGSFRTAGLKIGVIHKLPNSLRPLFARKVECEDIPRHECTKLCDRFALWYQFAALKYSRERWRVVAFYR